MLIVNLRSFSPLVFLAFLYFSLYPRWLASNRVLKTNDTILDSNIIYIYFIYVLQQKGKLNNLFKIFYIIFFCVCFVYKIVVLIFKPINLFYYLCLCWDIFTYLCCILNIKLILSLITCILYLFKPSIYYIII